MHCCQLKTLPSIAWDLWLPVIQSRVQLVILVKSHQFTDLTKLISDFYYYHHRWQLKITACCFLSIIRGCLRFVITQSV